MNEAELRPCPWKPTEFSQRILLDQSLLFTFSHLLMTPQALIYTANTFFFFFFN
jgi:hypothetical protein